MAIITIPPQLKGMKLFPLAPYSKVPLKGYHWREEEGGLERHPDVTSYGVDTGASGLVVIDCDLKTDEDGVSNFLAYAEDHGGLPETLTVETPNDGLHFYFKAHDTVQLRNSASTLLPGVDVRAEGGYVVGPNSCVKVKEEGTPLERYYLMENEEATIAELPQWLLEKLHSLATIAAPKEKTRKSLKKDSEDESPLTIAEKRRAVYWAQQKMAEAQEGERQSVLNKTAYFLGRKRVKEEVAQELVQAALVTGLSSEEAERTFAHGYQDGLQQEELEFDTMVKEYNSIMGKDIKKDPAEPAYYTHVALSHNFANAYPEQFIYWQDTSHWYSYNEETGAWELTPEAAMTSLVDKFLDGLVAEIRATNTYLPPYIYKLHEKLWSRAMIDSVTTTIRSRYGRTGSDIFDGDPNLLNCKNGVVDLRTGEVRPHSASYLISKVVPFAYKPGTKDRYCERVLESIHPEEREYLQLMAGQALTGHQPNYQAALFLNGRGSNGKSTFIDLLRRTSGTYGRQQAPSIFLATKTGGENYALSDFEGLRTAVVEELPNSKVLDTGALKRVVGTQKLTARALYSNYREFTNQATIFVSCNRLPMVNETDEGTWRRVLVFSFPYSYKKGKSEVVDAWDRVGDPRVLHAAQNRTATAEAFLAWRVEGAKRWYASERSEYTVPATVVERTAEWNASNDLILSWFTDTFQASEETIMTYVTFDDLLSSYNDYLINRGNRPVSARFLTTEFTNHRVFLQNKLLYRKSVAPLKDSHRSPYCTPDFPQGKPTKERSNHILGISFRK